MDTAGRAVVFAGTTVVIALLGMMLLGVEFLYGVAISASIGVLLMMLALDHAASRAAHVRGRPGGTRPSRRARASRGEGREGRRTGTRGGGLWLRWSASDPAPAMG